MNDHRASVRADRAVKILEISNYPPPRAGWGVRVSFVRRYLEDRGHEVHVLNVGPGRKIRSTDYLDVQGGFDYLRKIVRHAREGYLIHTHLNGDSPKGLVLTIVAELVGRITACPLVLTFHAGPEQRFFPRRRSRRFAPFYALAFALVHRIICNSEPVAARIVEYEVPASKIHVIPAFSRQYLDLGTIALPGDLDAFMLRHRPLLMCYFFNRPEFFLDSTFDAMVELGRSLPDCGMVLVGGDSTAAEISAKIAQRGLGGRCFQAGDVSHDQFLTILGRCHFYVRTPSKDGVCSSVLEALSLRVPVVASENGTRPDGTLTYVPDDATDLERRLREAWSDYDRIRSGLTPPPTRDTVEEEADLLVQVVRSH